MYLANSTQNLQLRMYHNLLSQYLEGNKSIETKKLFDDIIISTHYLLLDERKGYEIDHSIYDVVLPLYNFVNGGWYNKEYFSKLDPSSIGDEHFKTLSGILSSLAMLDDLDESK